MFILKGVIPVTHGKACATAVAFFVWSSVALGGEVRRIDGPGPMELHVHLTAKAGHRDQLEKAFRQAFYPAISKQEGFRHSDLLRMPDKDGEYVLTIAFESEDLRVRWANTPLHNEAWPKFSAHAVESKMSVEIFSVVASKSAK